MKKINFWEFKDELNFLKKKKLFTKIENTLQSGEIFFGKTLNKFEKKFLSINKSKYGLSVKNGTDALILSLICAGVKAGDEVITAANTFVATVGAITEIGAKPIIVD